jgi:hypothetical protein
MHACQFNNMKAIFGMAHGREALTELLASYGRRDEGFCLTGYDAV